MKNGKQKNKVQNIFKSRSIGDNRYNMKKQSKHNSKYFYKIKKYKYLHLKIIQSNCKIWKTLKIIRKKEQGQTIEVKADFWKSSMEFRQQSKYYRK